MADDDLSQWWDEDAQRLNKLAEAAREFAAKMPKEKGEERAFCPTGEGNGIDNSCGSSGGANAVVREVLSSIAKTGGFTVHPVTGQSPTTGYMCATVPGAEKVLSGREDITANTIRGYFSDHADYLSERPKLHLGGWIDSESGKVYLDLSERFETEAEATAAAVKHKQIAIWDLANGREVRIKGGDENGRRSWQQKDGSVRLPARSDSGADRRGTAEGSRRGHGREEEARSVDCGRGPGGIFGPGNKCQADGEDGPPSDEFGQTIAAKARGGGASSTVRPDLSWKQSDGPVSLDAEAVKASPPCRSLAGVNSVTIIHGSTLSQSLKETGVTLDQASKVCASLSEDADVTISHGMLSDISRYAQDPTREPQVESSVTFVSHRQVAGIPDAVAAATTLTRTEDEELLLTYASMVVSPEAQKSASVAVAREVYKSVVSSVGEAEKIGVSEVMMLAAGDKDDDVMKGYRLWPRLGFDGTIPRKIVTPTYSARLGFFEPYGSKIPDAILSDRAKAEKKAGKLTVQSLYDTREGQGWWEENGSTMPMSLRLDDETSSGWQRFSRIRDRVASRDMDEILELIGVEWRSIHDGAESRAFCATGDGNGVDNSCGSATLAGVDNSWKKSSDHEYSYRPGEGNSPVVGGDDIKSLSIERPADVASTMKELKVRNLTDVVAIGGGLTRGSFTSVIARGGEIHVMSEVPVDPEDEESASMGSKVTIGSDPDGKRYVDYKTMAANSESGNANLEGQDAARMSSILLERFPESLAAAEKAGIAYAKTFAMGDSQSDFKGYRLWPQFGFDAEIYSDVREKIPKDIISHDDPVTIQELISTPAGDRWWNDNGESMEMTLDFKDKKSDGYKRYQRAAKLSKRLKRRNEDRDVLEYWDKCSRAFCPNGEGNGIDNSCSSSGDGAALSSGKPASVRVQSDGELDGSMQALGLSGVDDVLALGGGNVRGAEVAIKANGEGFIYVSSVSPVDRDNSSAGQFHTSVSISEGEDGKELGLETLGLTGYATDLPRDKAAKVMSLVSEKVAESIDTAEKHDFAKVTTFAVGDAKSPYKGYRLWPQFGFDGDIPRDISKRIPSEIVLKAKGIEPPPPGSTAIPHELVLKGLASRHRNSLTIQELISSREGDRWWDENGSDVNLTLDLRDKSSPGYKKWTEMKARLPRLRERNKSRSFFDWLVEERAFCATGEGGGVKNDCSSQDGGDAAVASASLAKAKNVDVMLGGGQTVATIDAEARDRALSDIQSHPRPEGISPGSTADLWGRKFVERNGSSKMKITSTDPVFPMDRLAMSGTFVAHESVGQYLSMRDEDNRRAVGAEGPGAIIDTTQILPHEQFTYLVDALTDDVMHAYESKRFDPGFYSQDLEDAMSKMATRHPELSSDDNSRFVFTALTAILSNGQDPTTNLADSDGLYDMWKKSGTCVPSGPAGGNRDARPSLRLFQSMLDSFGVERTRNLLSGYTTAENVNRTLASMSERSGDPEWQERIGVSPWMIDHYKARDKRTGEVKASTNLVKTDASGEFPDEVVPMASIFGPKIGSFFANLNGRHDFLTMDRWLMRSTGRVTGELITRCAPEGASKRAKEALEALDVERWKSSVYMFGVDKQFGITKADLVRSLKIQQRTGVIEENGAAFMWATAAERSHKNTKKPDGGQYGKDPDPDKHACHQAGNSIFKSLIVEQQDPRGAQARRTMREVFRSVVKEIEAKYPDRRGRADVDEVQAILWQYEKNLWKHLGAKVSIDENSLYSKAADDLLTGKTKARRFSAESRAAMAEFDTSELDLWPFEAEQAVWDSDMVQSGIDFKEVLLELERLGSGKSDGDAFLNELQRLTDDSQDRSATYAARRAVVEHRTAGQTTVTMPKAGRSGLHVMGFDAKIPSDLEKTLPEPLSHCKTLLDLHVSDGGSEWWEQNGREIDVSIDLNGVQGRIFDDFAAGKSFTDIIEEGILDDYGDA
jgi:hypothetical protein